MKKRIFALLFALVMLVSSFGIVANAETSVYVIVSNSLIDNGLMTQDELVDLQTTGIELETVYGYAVLFAVIDEDLIGAYNGAESLYAEMTDNPNGMLWVHDEVNGVYDYCFFGDCEDIFGNETDRLKNAYDADKTYYGGIAAYYVEAEDVITAFNSLSVDNGNIDETYTDGYYDTENGGDDEFYEEEVADEEIAAETMPAVIDDAGLLNEKEYKDIDKKFRALSKEYGFEFVGVTAEDIGDMTANEYADVLYSIFKDSGIKDVAFYIYLHGDEGEREIVIVRYGKAEKELSDADCEKIIGNVKAKFADGKYADGFNGFVEETEKVFNPSVHWIWIPVCLIVGFVVAYLIMKGIASANKSVRKKVNASEYVDASTLIVTNAADIFLYSDVKSTAKSTTSSSDTDGGGRSTSSGKF